jgi:monoterpene epsilon-lactone hydrolase
LDIWAGYYAGGADRRIASLSPVFAELSGLPPLLLLVGEDEALLDDTLRVRGAAEAAGTEVRLHLGKCMQHDWPLTLPWLEESRLAWNVIKDFAKEFAPGKSGGKSLVE